LRSGNIRELAHRFQFDDHFTFNKQIDALPLYDLVLIHHIQFNLPYKADLSQFEFAAERFLVDRFEQTRAEYAMNLDGGTNDLLRQWI
jgi:hypothetical protein